MKETEKYWLTYEKERKILEIEVPVWNDKYATYIHGSIKDLFNLILEHLGLEIEHQTEIKLVPKK